jgi:hypothetical protein
VLEKTDLKYKMSIKIDKLLAILEDARVNYDGKMADVTLEEIKQCLVAFKIILKEV